jgi:hypothetical protein
LFDIRYLFYLAEANGIPMKEVMPGKRKRIFKTSDTQQTKGGGAGENKYLFFFAP